MFNNLYRRSITGLLILCAATLASTPFVAKAEHQILQESQTVVNLK